MIATSFFPCHLVQVLILAIVEGIGGTHAAPGPR